MAPSLADRVLGEGRVSQTAHYKENVTLITVTRRLAMQSRKIIRQALNITSRGLPPPVTFQTGPDGFRIRARTHEAAVEYHVPGDHPIEQIPVPLEFLADVEARKDEPVTLETDGGGHVTARWRDGSVPQMVRYDPVDPVDPAEFPRVPEELVGNPPRLLSALHDACLTTDPEPIRYAINCIQLKGGSGQIAATDGRQLLVQDGFTFPWEEDVLLVRTKLFGCRELPQDEPVQIGKTGDRVAVVVGPWRFFRDVNRDGRFPDVEGQIPQEDAAVAGCQVPTTDAEFLLKNLPRLPGDDEYNLPVTLELNGQAIVRAKAEGQPKPTELTLTNTPVFGEPIRVNTNRQYLARAMQLGFREIRFFSPKTPVLCRDDRRSYVWALLDPQSAVAPDQNAIRIESSESGANVQVPQTKTRKRMVTMSESNPNENGRAKSARRRRTSVNGKAGHDDVTALIEQAEALKTSLRESLVKTCELISSLKRHRKQSKAVRTALASLRELQPAGDR